MRAALARPLRPRRAWEARAPRGHPELPAAAVTQQWPTGRVSHSRCPSAPAISQVRLLPFS